MPPEKSAVDEFLGNLKEEKDPFTPTDPFKQEEVVDEKKEEEAEEEEKIPFHKDPKVQRFLEKEIAKALKNVPPTVIEKTVEKTEDEITDVLVRIIGNDTPEKQNAVKDFRRVLGSLEEKGAQRAIAQLQEQANLSSQEDLKAQQELDESFEEIEDTFGVDLSSNSVLAKKTRAEFVDYVRKVAPKDRETGEVVAFPDMVAAYEEFQDKNKRSTSRAKALASRSMTQSTDASAAPVVVDRSWKGIDKLFAKINS